MSCGNLAPKLFILKEMTMAWEWDKKEYSFFMGLADDEKIYYLYDFLFHGDEFVDDWDDDEWDEFDNTLGDGLEDDEWDDTPLKVDVILTETHFIISCKNKTIKSNTVKMFMMDGFMLLHQKDKGNASVYQIVGEGSPISLN